MQAFRVATTIDDESQLRLSDVPFRPGTAVDVIVLERVEDAVPSPVRADDDTAGGKKERLQLADEQYRMARQYPTEYVILIAKRIVFHSGDRQEAVQAYQRIATENPLSHPVIVSPGSKQRKPPMVRGRALTGKLRRTR